jgi:succinate dehydrogenase/fumarate reductase flavoprotein subunit
VSALPRTADVLVVGSGGAGLAAGEITGGVHGRNRMMGNSLLDCIVLRRRAGRAAALDAR